MATDIAAILANLQSFYDFTDRSVLHVGAGGGQFMDYAAVARDVLAVDPDAPAVDRLRAALREKDLEDRVHVLQADILSVTGTADVVFFEFCLHEIAAPAAALAHARGLAPEVLVADHAPGSQWSWLCGEEELVVRSWAAVDHCPVVREEAFEAVQRFHDFAELFAKLGGEGEPTLTRIEPYRERLDFTVPMPYRFALLAR